MLSSKSPYSSCVFCFCSAPSPMESTCQHINKKVLPSHRREGVCVCERERERGRDLVGGPVRNLTCVVKWSAAILAPPQADGLLLHGVADMSMLNPLPPAWLRPDNERTSMTSSTRSTVHVSRKYRKSKRKVPALQDTRVVPAPLFLLQPLQCPQALE